MLWEWGYWGQTVERWKKEGMKEDPRWRKNLKLEVYETGTIYLGNFLERGLKLDRELVQVDVDTSFHPPYKEKVLEEDDENIVKMTKKGQTIRIKKDGACMPMFIGRPIKDRKDFEELKERLVPEDPKRYPTNWEELASELRDRDYPTQVGGYPYGLYGALREFMGIERLSTCMYDDPNLIHDIMRFVTDFLQKTWDRAIRETSPDIFVLWEDLAYKNGPLLSPDFFREFILPNYKKLTGYLRNSGVNIIFVDSDGDITKLLPLFIEGGVTGVYPMEVQAGMDIRVVRKNFPNLQIMGGIDKMCMAIGKEAIDREIEEKVPFMLRHGGYVPHADHFIPPDVSWDDFLYYRERLSDLVVKLGTGK